MKANKEIEFLLKKHDYPVNEIEGKLEVQLKNKIIIDTQLTQRLESSYCSSRMDVNIQLPDNQLIIESFGDAGKDSEDAKIKNLQNFAFNSFHVITACMNEEKEDKQIGYEEWNIDGVDWEVFIGNFGIKGVIGDVMDFSELFNRVEKLVKGNIDNEKEYHWVRFFAAQYNNEISAIEFLVNNEYREEEQMELENFPWELRDEYYSIRNFMVLKKK